MELEAVTGKGLWGHKGPGSRLACSLYLRCWIEQLSACQLADRLMRTLSHSTQWWKGPYCLTSLIVEPAHISEPACWGLGCLFFLFSSFPSLFLNFFLPFSIFHPTSRTLSHPFNAHFSALFSFSFPSPHHLSPHSLSPSVSQFSKWWVLAYDRLSQVCFNYRRGDGDSTGEEEGENFCAHIIFKKLRIKCYLHHGGFCASLFKINRLLERDFSWYVNYPKSLSVFQGLVRKANLGRRKIIMGPQISYREVVAFLTTTFKICVKLLTLLFSLCFFFSVSLQCSLDKKKNWKKPFKFCSL